MPENKELKAFKEGLDAKKRGKKKGRSSGKRDVHLIPDVLMVTGALAPAINPDNSLIEDIATGNFRNIPGDLLYGYAQMDNLKPAVELVAVGAAAKVIGKATGLNRIKIPGLKKVRIL